MTPRPRPLTAAYYFPNFHVDPRNEQWHGTGWTEWDLLRRATPRFADHVQPRVPLDGYLDEADPAVMADKITVAAGHGLDAFLFDWYWYDGRPYLDRPLREAFLPAVAGTDFRFAIMWANHHWVNIHPWKTATPATELASGFVDAEQLGAASDHLIKTYLTHPSYLRLDDRPYLSIYDLPTMVRGLGGITATERAIADLRSRCLAAGLPGLHLNAIGWDQPVLPTEGDPEGLDIADLVRLLDLDSVSSYVWVHHHGLPRLQTPYPEVLAQAERGWDELAARFDRPYFPNVTVGWDPSPRTVQSDRYDPSRGYPHTNVITEATPENFGEAMDRALAFAHRTGAELISINAWNEWTEGSYLEPDTRHGTGHLEQLRRAVSRHSAS